MVKRWYIGLGVASLLLLVSSSLAQNDSLGSLFDSELSLSGDIVLSSNNENLLISGQNMTEVDTEENNSAGLSLLSGDSNRGSGETEQNSSSGVQREETISGEIYHQNSDPLFHLILSEVYYDGTDEWIEITNIGDGNFQGTISLLGVKSTPLLLTNISLLSGESKLFGDTLTQISGVVAIEKIGKTGLAFNILDTAPIYIQLFISGQNEDSFLVDQYRVNKYNDKKTSFEKVGGVSTRVESGRVANAHTGNNINPGIYFSTGMVVDVSFPPGQSSGEFQLPLPCLALDQRDLIKINEIFLGNEKYPPYIELAIHENITIDSLSLSGDYLSGTKEFLGESGAIKLEKNSLLLLSATGFWKDEGMISLQNSGIMPNTTGHWLTIIAGSGQSRRVLDMVYLSGNSIGKSLYFTKTSQQCARVFDAVDEFSPGFEPRFLKYFSGVTITKIECISPTTGTESSTGACLSTGQIETFSGEKQVTEDISGIIQQYTIHILHVDYDPEGSDTDNEKITLLATNILGNTLPLDLSKIFRLKVNGTNKTLPWILPMNIPTTFTKTFGFPNSSTSGQKIVVQLTYGDYIFDTYSYDPNLADKEEEKVITGSTDLSGTTISLSGLNFSFTYVLPNPKGSDTQEEVGIYIGAESGVNSITGLDMIQGFALKIGTRSKKIYGTGYIGQENIFSGNLGLVNKAACVSLMYKEQELSKFCYGKPKEGQKLYTSDQGLEKTSEENISILNSLQIKKIGTDLCIWYEGKAFLCKHIPAGKAAIKTIQEQKLYKGFASLIKQYMLTNWKDLYYSSSLKHYYDLVAKNKKLIALGVTKVNVYGQSLAVTDLKKQLQVMETTLPGVIAAFVGWEALISK